ncbi:MAG: luciferase family protein [Solirubrobacteraceae bacterium]|nr:DUF5519 family protein [Patulibacter sp.]
MRESTTTKTESGARAAGVPGAKDAITAEVTAWEGVHAETGRRGEWSLRVGRRELGHLHGDRVAHFGLAKEVWHELHDAGRITDHPVFPGRVGPAARAIRTEADRHDVVAIMRLNYDRLVAAGRVPAGERVDLPVT